MDGKAEQAPQASEPCFRVCARPRACPARSGLTPAVGAGGTRVRCAHAPWLHGDGLKRHPSHPSLRPDTGWRLLRVSSGCTPSCSACSLQNPNTPSLLCPQCLLVRTGGHLSPFRDFPNSVSCPLISGWSSESGARAGAGSACARPRDPQPHHPRQGQPSSGLISHCCPAARLASCLGRAVVFSLRPLPSPRSP